MTKRAAGMYVDHVTENGKELLGFLVTCTHMNLFSGILIFVDPCIII
jgi:hypothetical protein